MQAAKRALLERNANYILIWVPREAEGEVRRAGEGAPFTGLKPAGLDEGPVVPRAERAIETGDPREVVGFVLHAVEEDLQRRFRDVMAKKQYAVDDVEGGRAYVQASSTSSSTPATSTHR